LSTSEVREIAPREVSGESRKRLVRINSVEARNREINAWFGWAKDDVTRKALVFLEALDS
jgi:hypothetical protein